MRIISGKLKGELIDFIKNSTTRPLKDSVKENIFNILEHSKLIKVKIKDANILDLYSGVGSFGLECLSRGAKNVTFVEKDKNALNILKENLIKLSVFKQSKIIDDNIENLSNFNIKVKYNIFFLDPPFTDTKFIQNLILIQKNKIYEKKHIIMIHRERNSLDELSSIITPVIIKQYGRSKIIFGYFS